jgi:peptidoglycan/LPS O-acetylase OafA/YrhL
VPSSFGFFRLDGTGFPGFGALLPVFGTALLILAGPEAWLNRLVLSRTPCVALGEINYPLYLWHWPMLAFPYLFFGDPSWTVRVGALVVSAVLAAGTFRFVETPIRRDGSDTTAKLLVAASVVVALVGSLVSQGLIPPYADSRAVAEVDAAFGDWGFPRA